MEEKIQSVQYRDSSEPSEFAHKPPKQEMDLSCSPGRLLKSEKPGSRAFTGDLEASLGIGDRLLECFAGFVAVAD